jgi:ATP-binding cassette subfamily B protein
MLRLLSGFGVLQVVNVVFALALAGGQMVRISPLLAGYLLVPVLIALVIVQLFIRRLFLLLRRMQVELASMSDHVLASYRGIATVHGFAAGDAFSERFDDLNEQYRTTLIQRSEIRALLQPTLTLAVSVDVFLLLFVGGPMAVRGEITVGEVVALTALVAWVSIPLRASAFLVSVLKQAQAALERIDVLLYTPPDRPELPDATAPGDAAPTVELRHLTYAWPGQSEPALRDISLTLPAGSSLGILGLTGSGKSTLLSLLSRLRNPPRGTILVDGVDILDLDLDQWRERVTVVPQRAFLFSESIHDNILLGVTDQARLDRVLDLTALAPDIAALPEGVRTEVGESGVRLSGGQRQRCALARGLARSHRMLLLDDVLSAVDHATEAQLIDTLRNDPQGATTVLVAHRVSALLHCDQVLVLDGGRAVDLGAPADLLERPGLFRDTWEQQRAEQEEVAS